MWESQSQAEQAAVAARFATARANKLLRQAHIGDPDKSDKPRTVDTSSGGYNSLTSSTILYAAGTATPRHGSIENSSDDDRK